MSNLKTVDVANTPYTPEIANRIIGHIAKQTSQQQVAATLAASLLWIADFDGEIGDLYVQLSSATAAGETLTVDVLKNGVSVLTGGPALIAAATPAKTQVAIFNTPFLPFASTSKGFARGDVFTVSRVYTPGGTPTLAATSVVLEPSRGRIAVR